MPWMQIQYKMDKSKIHWQICDLYIWGLPVFMAYNNRK